MMEYLCLELELNKKEYDSLLLKYANFEAATTVLAIKDLNQGALDNLEEKLEEHLGNPIDSKDFSNTQKIFEKEYMVGDVRVVADLWDMSNRNEYDTEFEFIPLTNKIKSWGEAQMGKRHIALRIKEYFLPERDSDILIELLADISR